jgi:C-terminal peptidase (prc)
VKQVRIALIVLVVMLVASLTMGGYEAPKETKPQSKEDLYNQVELFSDAITVMRSEYVTEVDSKKAIYGALRGMLSSLDDFSQFLDPDEYKELTSDTKGEFGGIGVEITLKDGILTVITPMVGTPAESAGLKPGDKIVRINGNTTKDMLLNDAVKIMRGDPGTMVTLTVWREKEEKVVDISIKRAIIKIDSVKDVYLIEDKIGYIRLVEFQEKCAPELEAALKKLEGQGMDSLILDLRNNPGGLLEASIAVSEKFIPKDGVIVSTNSRDTALNAVYRSSGVLTHPSWPLIVLVNDGSASAAEIVAGAIQDNKRGVVVGVKTFGKASVQTVIPLKDGSALRITTAYYLTPGGKSISNHGIIPDVIVGLEESTDIKNDSADIFEKVNNNNKDIKAKKTLGLPKKPIERDNQLQRAIDLMKAIRIYRR